MKKILKSVARSVYLAFESAINSKFYSLRQQTNGMLLPIVYKRIYQLCYKLPDLDIVEVGGATGAASIAIAWAIRDAKKNSKLIVVEKCQGGTRTDIGGYDENLQLIQRHFEDFGVREQLRLFPHELTFEKGDEVIDLIQTPKISAFIHDADGRIDRDFYLFWPLLEPGGLIIVDDYANKESYKPISERHPTGSAKSMITYRLLNQIIEWGLFQTTHKIGKTIFGIKPYNADFNRFDRKVCQQIVETVERERDDCLKSHEKSLVTR